MTAFGSPDAGKTVQCRIVPSEIRFAKNNLDSQRSVDNRVLTFAASRDGVQRIFCAEATASPPLVWNIPLAETPANRAESGHSGQQTLSVL